jgi:hypothetical protein
MKTFFGKADPTAFDVLTGTFGQILSSGANEIGFAAKDKDHVFWADVDWIESVSDIIRELRGGLIPYPKLGDNVCRIETAYRYLYGQVLYGDVDGVKLIKDGDTLSCEQWNKGQKQYRLILREFGKYLWDEKPEVLQL